LLPSKTIRIYVISCVCLKSILLLQNTACLLLLCLISRQLKSQNHVTNLYVGMLVLFMFCIYVMTACYISIYTGNKFHCDDGSVHLLFMFHICEAVLLGCFLNPDASNGWVVQTLDLDSWCCCMYVCMYVCAGWRWTTGVDLDGDASSV
jgi:hypothetical protein